MKKYKLLKELPGLEVGTILKLNTWILSLEEGEMDLQKKYTLHSLEQLIKNGNINGWLEEIKEEPKSIYELEKGDDYYYIEDIGYTSKCNTIWGLYEMYRLEFGNVFLTEKEAKKEFEKRKALAKIKKWIWENKIELGFNCNSYGYRIGTEIDVIHLDKYKLTFTETYLKTIDGIVFKYEEDAEKCLEECKQEWNILFDLK